MTPVARALIILLLSPLVVLAIHMALGRISRGVSPQLVAIRSVFAGYIPTFILLWMHAFSPDSLSRADVFARFLYCFIVYSSLAYTYFHFFNTSETARRIRVLYEIFRAKSVSMKDITELYRTSDVIALRLERLVSMRQLKLEDGSYSLDKRLLYRAALVVHAWRVLLGLHRAQK